MSNAVIIRNRFLGALIFACLYSCITAAVDPKTDDASLRINGKALGVLGPSACKNKQTKVEIIFSDATLWQKKEFRAYSISTSEKDKRECPKAPSDSTGVQPFYENDHFINLETLLVKSDACPKDGSGAKGERILCIYPYASGDEKPIAQVRYSYNTLVAKIKNFSEPVAANGEIIFTVNITGGSVKEMEVCYGPAKSNIKDECPADTKKPGWEKYPWDTNKQVKIQGLDPQVTYNVKVRLLATGNDEKWVEEGKDLKPVAIAGALDTYNGEGGVLMYSCNASPNAADCAILAFIAALFIVMRNRSRLTALKKPLLILPLLFLAPQESRAEFGTVSVGILGSMYRPNLDSETGANDFYKCHFRGAPKEGVFKEEGPINPLMGFDINWHLWDGLRVGFGVGYTYVAGVGLEIKNNRSLCDKRQETYPTSMHMYQIRPQLSYELDHFVEYFPLFPYVRGALIGQGYHIFNGETGSKEKTNPQGKTIKNSGFSFGWQAALGLKLRLDFLEPGAVRSAHSAEFFDHVYLMSELSYEKINNFGKAGFDFSPKDIMGTKLPLMWTFGLVFDLL